MDENNLLTPEEIKALMEAEELGPNDFPKLHPQEVEIFHKLAQSGVKFRNDTLGEPAIPGWLMPTGIGKAAGISNLQNLGTKGMSAADDVIESILGRGAFNQPKPTAITTKPGLPQSSVRTGSNPNVQRMGKEEFKRVGENFPENPPGYAKGQSPSEWKAGMEELTERKYNNPAEIDAVRALIARMLDAKPLRGR